MEPVAREVLIKVHMYGNNTSIELFIRSLGRISLKAVLISPGDIIVRNSSTVVGENSSSKVPVKRLGWMMSASLTGVIALRILDTLST